MDDYNFNFEKRTLLTHFAAAFDGVRIKRYDGKKLSKEIIKVPLVFAPKSHILQDILGTTDTVRLPIMAVEIKSEGRDNTRVKNKLGNITYKNPDGTYTALEAIPWNITVEMTVLAKYHEDMDQIIQNFSTNTDPYVVVSWREPKSGREIRTEILWDGNVAYTYPGNSQAPTAPPFRITATASFVIKGYIFKVAVENPKPICLINTEYLFVDNFFCNYAELTAHVQINSRDVYSISGSPVLRYVTPHYVKEGSSPTIRLQGLYVPYAVAVYVSGSDPHMYNSSVYQPFSGISSFNAFPVDTFKLSNNNTLTFTLPPPETSGFIDVIVVNSCGYGTLTEGSSEFSTFSAGLISLDDYTLSSLPVSCT